MAGGRDFFGGRQSPALVPAPAFQVKPYMPPRRPSRPRTSAAGQDMFWLLFAGLIAGFVLLVFQPNRERIHEARAECRLLEQEIAEFAERAAHLRRWAEALGTGDREAWAAVARERLAWLAPGERVLTAPEDAHASPGRGAAGPACGRPSPRLRRAQALRSFAAEAASAE